MLPAASDNGAVLVTGASSGIGEELAREFSRRGRHVVLVARRADKLQALAASLGSARRRAGRRPLQGRRPRRPTRPDRRARPRRRRPGQQRGLEHVRPGRHVGPRRRTQPRRGRRRRRRRPVQPVRPRHGLARPRRGAQRRIGRRLRTRFPGRRRTARPRRSCCPTPSPSARSCTAPASSPSTLCPGPVKTGFGAAAGISDADAEAALPKVMWVERRRRRPDRSRRFGRRQVGHRSRRVQPGRRRGVQDPAAPAAAADPGPQPSRPEEALDRRRATCHRPCPRCGHRARQTPATAASRSAITILRMPSIAEVAAAARAGSGSSISS